MTARQLKPTVKEIKLVDGIARGKTKRQAGVDAGYTGSLETVQVTVSQTLKKPSVQELLAKALERHGINVDAALKPIADGLTAEKVSIVGNGEQAMAEVTPDHAIRLKASGMALNLMGISRPAGDVTINFVQASQQQKADYDL
jgi:phage terminase small subunit